MAVRKRVLKYKSAVRLEPESHIELMKRLLEDNPRPNPERDRFFAGLISKMEEGKMSEADFKRELGAMKREGERPREGYRRYMFLGMGGSRKESSIGRIGRRIALMERRKAEPERTRPAEEPRIVVSREKKLKQFEGGTNLRENTSYKIRRFKKELRR